MAEMATIEARSGNLEPAVAAHETHTNGSPPGARGRLGVVSGDRCIVLWRQTYTADLICDARQLINHQDSTLSLAPASLSLEPRTHLLTKSISRQDREQSWCKICLQRP